MLNGAPGNRLSRAALICPLVFAAIGLAQTDTDSNLRVEAARATSGKMTASNQPSPQSTLNAAIASESIAACCFLSCTDSNLSACLTSDDCLAGETCVTIDESTSTCQRICVDDTQCPAGTCEPSCGLMQGSECAAYSGWHLAPPNRIDTISTCVGTCLLGSCCLEDHECEDWGPLDWRLNKDDCDALGGGYLGGTTCCGKRCGGGPRETVPCCSPDDCWGFECIPFDQGFIQPYPCPTCDLESPSQCQAFAYSPPGRKSDLSVPGGPTVADDLRPLFDTLESLCVWGYYNESDFGGTTIDCAHAVQDDFFVAVYGSDVLGLPDPGAFFASSWASAATSPENTPTCDPSDNCNIYSSKLTLDTPITGLDSTGQTIYWLEVSNATTIPAENQCAWHWAEALDPHNDYSAAGSFGSYLSLTAGDLAFCLDGDFEAPPAYQAACCTCEQSCTVSTLRSCSESGSVWLLEQSDCDAGCPILPLGTDDCSNLLSQAPLTGQVSLISDNRCATTDGPNSVPTEQGPTVVTHDLWYKYEADCDGEVIFSTCAAGNTFPVPESAIMAYSGCGSCPTDADHLSRLFPDGIGYRDNCSAQIEGLGAFVAGPASVGDCFLVRVGSAGPVFGQGDWTLVAECAPGCDPPSAPPDEWNRYLTLGFLGCDLPPSAIQVTIVDMPRFPERVGETWWAGAPFAVGAEIQSQLDFAELECTSSPVFVDWWPDPELHLFGAAILPGSTYEVRQCWNGGASCTDPVTVSTGQWGDVVAPFGGPAQPNFGDISAIVAAFTEAPGAPSLVAADLAGNGGAEVPNQSIDFGDITRDVGAFKGLPYPYSGPSSCAAQ